MKSPPQKKDDVQMPTMQEANLLKTTELQTHISKQPDLSNASKYIAATHAATHAAAQAATNQSIPALSIPQHTTQTTTQPTLSNATKHIPTAQNYVLTVDDERLRKLDMLRNLGELVQNGIKLSQNYNMNSDYCTMKCEYDLHKGIRAKQNAINWLSSILLNCIYGIEILNDRYNPFDLKLKGWSEQMNADAHNYYEVFGELYEKYNKPGKSMPPEIKLILMITGSAVKFHLTNTLMSNLSSMTGATSSSSNSDTNELSIMNVLRKFACKNSQPDLSSKHEEDNNNVISKINDLKFLKEKELEHLKQQQEQFEKETLDQNLKQLADLQSKIHDDTDASSVVSASTHASSKVSTRRTKKKMNIIKIS
jgi:hypothetical protein